MMMCYGYVSWDVFQPSSSPHMLVHNMEGRQKRKGYSQRLLRWALSSGFQDLSSRSWALCFQKLRFCAYNHMDLEVKVQGRFLQFLCLKSHLGRKWSTQMETSMRWMRQKIPTDPTLHISYCFRCSDVFMKKKKKRFKKRLKPLLHTLHVKPRGCD